VTSDKGQLVDMARNYYRRNTKMLKLVETFYQSYRSSDALRWCRCSPFPAPFLNDALYSHNSEQLRFCSFLLNDTSHILKQQSKRNSGIELYRGTKLPTELVEKLEKHNKESIHTLLDELLVPSKPATPTLTSPPSTAKTAPVQIR
jgi:hypothetical protein